MAQGAVQVVTSLLGRPSCKAQMVEEKEKGYDSKEWKNIDKLDRLINLPAGFDLAPVFRG